jgi:hypothetical protein
MTHQEKLQLMRGHLAALGVSKAYIAPLPYRLLWRLGIDVPPPLFANAASIVVVVGSLYGLLYLGAYLLGLLTVAAIHGRDFAFESPDIFVYIGFATLLGMLIGFLEARRYRRIARDLKLPPWSVYRGATAAS